MSIVLEPLADKIRKFSNNRVMVRYDYLYDFIKFSCSFTNIPQPENCHDTECSICLESCTDRTNRVTTACGHVFHPACLVEHFSFGDRCPNCRRDAVDTVDNSREGMCIRFLCMLTLNVRMVEKSRSRRTWASDCLNVEGVVLLLKAFDDCCGFRVAPSMISLYRRNYRFWGGVEMYMSFS